MAKFLHEDYKDLSTSMLLKLLREAKSEWDALASPSSDLKDYSNDVQKQIKGQNVELLEEYNFRMANEDSEFKAIKWEEIII